MLTQQTTPEAPHVTIDYKVVNEKLAGDLRPTLKNLQSEDIDVRTSAEATLAAYIKRNVRIVERSRKLRIAITVPVLVATLCDLPGRTTWGGHPHPVMLALSAAAWMGTIYLCCQLPSSRAGQRLAALDDPRLIPTLLDVSALARHSDYSAVRKPLAKLVARMTPVDYARLDGRHRKTLCQIIGIGNLSKWNESNHSNLKLAILRALARSGDEEAIPAVGLLKNLSPAPEIRTAAAECLSALRLSVAQAAQGKMLLRAADGRDGEGALLRPASEAEQNAAQLLRAPVDVV